MRACDDEHLDWQDVVFYVLLMSIGLLEGVILDVTPGPTPAARAGVFLALCVLVVTLALAFRARVGIHDSRLGLLVVNGIVWGLVLGIIVLCEVRFLLFALVLLGLICLGVSLTRLLRNRTRL